MPKKRRLEDLLAAQRNIAGRHERQGNQAAVGTPQSGGSKAQGAVDGAGATGTAPEGLIWDTSRLDNSKWVKDGTIHRPLIACDTALLI